MPFLLGFGGSEPPMDSRRSRPCEGVAAFFRLRSPRKMTGLFEPGHDDGGLGLSPMKPSAKRALLLPAWPERKLYWRAAGFFGLRPATESGGADGGVRPFFGLARPGGGAAGWHWVASLGAVVAIESVRWGEGRDGAAMTGATRAQQAEGMRSAGTKRRMDAAQRRGGRAGNESDGRHRGGWLG